VLLEAPGRGAKTLSDLRGALGDRRAAMVRELTKLHQEVLRGPLPELHEILRDRELKGEVVLVVEGAREAPAAGDLADAVRQAGELVTGGARKRDAARQAARATGVPASRIYAALIGKG